MSRTQQEKNKALVLAAFDTAHRPCVVMGLFAVENFGMRLLKIADPEIQS
jgi:hypothetical protein